MEIGVIIALLAFGTFGFLFVAKEEKDRKHKEDIVLNYFSLATEELIRNKALRENTEQE